MESEMRATIPAAVLLAVVSLLLALAAPASAQDCAGHAAGAIFSGFGPGLDGEFPAGGLDGPAASEPTSLFDAIAHQELQVPRVELDWWPGTGCAHGAAYLYQLDALSPVVLFPAGSPWERWQLRVTTLGADIRTCSGPDSFYFENTRAEWHGEVLIVGPQERDVEREWGGARLVLHEVLQLPDGKLQACAAHLYLPEAATTRLRAGPARPRVAPEVRLAQITLGCP
jgi:hypothetical protein